MPNATLRIRKPLIVRLDPDQQQALRMAAAVRGISMSALMRGIIDRWLADWATASDAQAPTS